MVDDSVVCLQNLLDFVVDFCFRNDLIFTLKNFCNFLVILLRLFTGFGNVSFFSLKLLNVYVDSLARHFKHKLLKISDVHVRIVQWNAAVDFDTIVRFCHQIILNF